MINVLINGCNGAMGQVLAKLIQESDDCIVACGVDKFPNALPNLFPVFSSMKEVNTPLDAVADFSRPEALDELLDFCTERSIPLILATTGHTREQEHRMKEVARTIPIFKSANYSLGVNLVMDLITKATAFLGEGFDIEIIEKHHNRKVDAPSGTALMLADLINETLSKPKDYVFDRHERTERRSKDEIGIHAIRGGTIVGEHEVLFIGNNEVVSIKHTAESRQVFAVGVIRAVQFIQGKPAGFYSMKDMLLASETVTNLYVDRDEAMITLHDVPQEPGVMAALFQPLAAANVNLDMISQTSPYQGKLDLSFTLPRLDLARTSALMSPILSAHGITTEVFSDISKLTIEGLGMEQQAGVASRLFEVMSEHAIRILTITTSETKISFCISEAHESGAIDALKTAFHL